MNGVLDVFVFIIHKIFSWWMNQVDEEESTGGCK
jgi:hypothetical protein